MSVSELISALAGLFPGLIVVIFLLALSLKVVRETQRVVVYRVGKLKGIFGPGIVWVFPFIDKVITIELNQALPEWRGMSELERIKRLREQIETAGQTE